MPTTPHFYQSCKKESHGEAARNDAEKSPEKIGPEINGSKTHSEIQGSKREKNKAKI